MIKDNVQVTIDFIRALKSIGISDKEAAWLGVAHRKYQYHNRDDEGKFKYNEEEAVE